MRELFDFFIRNSKWFVYAIFVVASCMLLFQGNPYHHHVIFTSANSVASTVYATGNNVTSYFKLRDINEDLNRRNASLEKEVINLREQLQRFAEANYTDTLDTEAAGIDHFDFIVARVINNSISHPFNYLTLDKGTDDGVRAEYGVIDQNGVVGIVSVASKRYARVISLLNPNLRLSCKIKDSDYFGSLVWDGDDPTTALLEELPRHTTFNPGDTIVTGYSAVFPTGLPVGVIIDDGRRHNENFFTLKIRLLADFTALGNVQIVKNNYAEEIAEIEQQDQMSDNKFRLQ